MPASAPAPRDVLRLRKELDQFRTTLKNGRIIFSRSVAAMPVEAQTALLKEVMRFDKWEPDVIEHDTGEVTALGCSCWFKIDDYGNCAPRFRADEGSRFVLTLFVAAER